MARQPFLPTHRGKSTSVGRGVIEPRLAAVIAKCNDNWTHVDLQLALTMGSLLGIENPASVAVFTALRNNRAQREAIQAAANATLPDGSLKDIFGAIMNVHRNLDSLRNDIVHGIWGKSAALPDAAIWSSLQDHAVMLIEDYHNLRPDHSTPGYDRSERMTRDYFVWKYEELESIADEIGALADAIGNFHSHLRYRGIPAGESALNQLCASPLIQKELARMTSSGKKTP